VKLTGEEEDAAGQATAVAARTEMLRATGANVEVLLQAAEAAPRLDACAVAAHGPGALYDAYAATVHLPEEVAAEGRMVLEAALQAVAADEVDEQRVGGAAVAHVRMLELELEGFGSFLENTRCVSFGCRGSVESPFCRRPALRSRSVTCSGIFAEALARDRREGWALDDV
jgi:hypothetical protein